MNIKLIAADMDGTLLDTDRFTVPPRNISALRAASAKGVKIAIASGRSWSLIAPTAETLGCVDFGVTANGGFIADSTGAPIWEQPMSAGQSKAMMDVLRARGIAFEGYCQGRNYLDRSGLEGAKAFPSSEQFIAFYMKRVILTDDMFETVGRRGFEKFHVFHVPPEIRADVLRELESTDPFAVASGDLNNMELTAPQVNKGAALAALSEKLGITAAEVMTFGDADNDLEMLEWAGASFAMANATENAKRAAKFSTGTNHEAGIAQAIEQYVL